MSEFFIPLSELRQMHRQAVGRLKDNCLDNRPWDIVRREVEARRQAHCIKQLERQLKAAAHNAAYLEMLLARAREDARQELREEARQQALPEYNAEAVRYSPDWTKSAEGLPESGAVVVDGYGETVYFDGEHWYDWPYGWQWSQRPLQVDSWRSIPWRVDREEIGAQLGEAVGRLLDMEGDELALAHDTNVYGLAFRRREPLVRPDFYFDDE
jgi:hypothetical protein